MKYREISFNSPREMVDILCSKLYDYPVQGVEIIDKFIEDDEREQMFVDDLDFDNIKTESVPIKFYLSEEENVKELLESIKEDLDQIMKRTGFESVSFELDESDEEDWANNWKKYYKPFAISDRIVINPLWENLDDYPNFKDHEIVIKMEPGMAFGSGTHETTSMCVKSLEKYLQEKDTMIDVGCGSGILGIAAAKLGAGHGTLIDLDPAACKVAKENLITNGVDHCLEVIQGDLLTNDHPVVDLVVANIFAEIIIQITQDVFDSLKSQGLFIASGIIVEKEDDVKKKLSDVGFETIETMRDGGWVAIISRKVQ